MTPSSLSADPAASTAAALKHALFGERLVDHHAPWRRLLSTEPFRFQEGLTPGERAALSYERLGLINRAIDDVPGFVGDVERLAALHEWVGPVDAGLGTVASIHYNLFLGSLLDHASSGPERDLREFVELRRTGTFLCTEAGHGNSAVQLETTAVYDAEAAEFVLHTPHPGARKFMPNTSSTGGPKTAVVAARLIADGKDQGVFLFLTPLSDDAGSPLPGVGIHRLPQTATAPVDHCATSFDRVRLPYSALVQSDHGRLTPEGVFSSSVGSPRKRFLHSVGRVTAGKLCMSAYSLGVTRHAVAVAVRHAHTRQTSGVTGGNVPLFAHRSHHAPLLASIATAYAATLLHRTALRRWAEAATEADREDAERFTAIAKGWITWQARTVMTECRERCGAQGLFLANGIAGQVAANEGTITAEGDNLVIWVKAAGEMLLGHFDPAPSPQLGPADRDLADPAFLQDLLADIERIWHHRARARLRGGEAGNPLGRWNRAVTPALRLVDAHAHLEAAGALLAAAGEAADPQARRQLLLLHRLFALRQVSAHSGDLLVEGCLTGDQVRCLPDVSEDTVVQLEPHARTLTDAFAVIDEVLLAHPISRPEELAGDRGASSAKPLTGVREPIAGRRTIRTVIPRRAARRPSTPFGPLLRFFSRVRGRAEAGPGGRAVAPLG
ncbi:Acyl-CoA oxidase [Streptomyces sp. ADI96-02]|uniref:acyl-CoA dehydrogenase family protein n=1 Tax=Streptomyces sp. ADI96-02 TaxID=1522760 RepID=UPI000F5557FE|nr:acyl-CoA dehydrogenase [Streptomyces sp. ADI96-02]RPK54113.1 Acyl-CoA oxidase [Streptomyces sp. ADI96-02]